MNEVTVLLQHNGKVIRELETSLDIMHKLIGVMTYGGWKPNEKTKFLVDDYHFVSLEPFIVQVNLITEPELNKRTAEQMQEQMQGLNSDFASRLAPIFKRKPAGELN